MVKFLKVIIRKMITSTQIGAHGFAAGRPGRLHAVFAALRFAAATHIWEQHFCV